MHGNRLTRYLRQEDASHSFRRGPSYPPWVYACSTWRSRWPHSELCRTQYIGQFRGRQGGAHVKWHSDGRHCRRHHRRHRRHRAFRNKTMCFRNQIVCFPGNQTVCFRTPDNQRLCVLSKSIPDPTVRFLETTVPFPNHSGHYTYILNAISACGH